MGNFISALKEYWFASNIPTQLAAVDFVGLFTNPCFIIPFVALMGWWAYKQEVNSIVVTCLVIGLWYFTGTPYASGLTVDGQLQLGKIIPVAGVGLGAVFVVVYLIFLRD